jgi:hypothetical protein
VNWTVVRANRPAANLAGCVRPDGWPQLKNTRKRAFREEPMKDYLASVEKLRLDAADAALIRDLATDKTKRDMFNQLHEHMNRLAEEIEQAMNPTKPSEAG